MQGRREKNGTRDKRALQTTIQIGNLFPSIDSRKTRNIFFGDFSVCLSEFFIKMFKKLRNKCKNIRFMIQNLQFFLFFFSRVPRKSPSPGKNVLFALSSWWACRNGIIKEEVIMNRIFSDKNYWNHESIPFFGFAQS